jgi:hypothetical protein
MKMEKIKFTIQVVVLILAFPVLFFAGVKPATKPAESKAIPVVIKTAEKDNCICKSDCHYKIKLIPASLKN